MEQFRSTEFQEKGQHAPPPSRILSSADNLNAATRLL